MRLNDLRDRTKRLAVRVVRFAKTLPNNRAGWITGDQLLRAATSTAANYRAARRARSRREFIAKLGIVEEEADETVFWLELIAEAEVVSPEVVADLRREASELTAIVVAALKRAKSHQRREEHPHFRLRTSDFRPSGTPPPAG